jgi:DNA polymerase I-like protein with 3'-5' exonuclease and polymerase domains
MLAFADVERNGIRVDVEYLDKEIERTRARIKQGEAKLKKSKVWGIWKRRYRSKAKLGSKQQLAVIFFDELGYTRNPAGKKHDKVAFAKVDHPFIRRYFKVAKLKKVVDTYLLGIRREVVGDRAHVFFNLHTVKTYRGSADSFSYQNLPIRDPEMGAIVRKAFIPSPGYVLVEIDYGGLEFCMAGAITNDKHIRRYLKTGGDPHRDLASLIFMCKPEQVTKKMRYCAKNMFVFPLLYGSFYRSCAPILWSAIETLDLKIGDQGLMEHVNDHGVHELGRLSKTTDPGTFEHHLKECEKEYTQVRFKQCFNEQRKAYEHYQKTGLVEFVTGFTASGILSRNDVYNWRIQGPAFHCLLWSLIQLNRWLVKSKMRSKIVGNIHDSIVAEVHVDELEDYLTYAQYIMTDELRQRWKWVNVPLSIEAEVTPENGSWHDKEVYEI